MDPVTPTTSTNIKELIEEANRNAVELMMEADPVWVDIGLARNMIPGMKEEMLLHAGPPIRWEKMSGPMRGAVIGASIYEGWATNEIEAERLAASDRISFAPNHHYNAVGPMAGHNFSEHASVRHPRSKAWSTKCIRTSTKDLEKY